ncbi:unnamed protein product (mitochondrion) [Plasmodiophora brassicae]|uniref:GH16 domain-containing protein n=1 Tax=Plasmodiophora brassicae TaxID=37360 RepID=A0A3P3YFJ8_PLABS|nr:unnamed protein product [Plasmodiophora brassicae]
MMTQGMLMLLVAVGVTARTALAVYIRTESWTPTNFLDQFDFFDGPDPTHGYVEYVDRSTASSRGLLPVVDGVQLLRADSTTVLDASVVGRRSVRIHSKQTFNSGLFLLDITHMPVGCGTWPAYWFVGKGEFDVLEGINNETSNYVVYHTEETCTLNATRHQTATVLTTSCHTVPTGCGNQATTPGSYGTAFNNNGGGIYAALWDKTGIFIWMFPRQAIPNDIVQGSPHPDLWPIPMTNLSFSASSCAATAFGNTNIVMDLTFCGDWAGSKWVWEASDCQVLAPTCNAFVAANPHAFKEASNRALCYDGGVADVAPVGRYVSVLDHACLSTMGSSKASPTCC